MSIYGSINEGYIKNEPDIYYNKEKFDSGEINLCFITGHSGSGKSTMARNLAEENNVEHYELDDVIANKENFSMENFKEYGDLIYSFFKGIGKKYYFTSKDVKEGKHPKYQGDYEKDLINDFVKYSINYSKSHKNKKYVIEGIWLLKNIEPSLIKDYAVYIKGTSALISAIRAAKRDKMNIRNSLYRIIISTTGKDEFEKKIRKYRDYFSNLMNSEE